MGTVRKPGSNCAVVKRILRGGQRVKKRPSVVHPNCLCQIFQMNEWAINFFKAISQPPRKTPHDYHLARFPQKGLTTAQLPHPLRVMYFSNFYNFSNFFLRGSPNFLRVGPNFFQFLRGGLRSGSKIPPLFDPLPMYGLDL